MSGGQKKLLEIGRVLMARPQMILLDEPVAGVNPSLTREIAAHLRSLVDDGLSVLLIEHHMDTIARICDHVIVLAEGQNLAEGSVRRAFAQRGGAGGVHGPHAARTRLVS